MDTTKPYVSFAGAGTHGFAYPGFLQALAEHLGTYKNVTYDEWRESLQGIAGCSAGAVAALMLALGLDACGRRDTTAEFYEVRGMLQNPDFALLLKRFGMVEGGEFKEMIQRVLMRGGLSHMSTMKDMKRLLRVDVAFVCTDIQTGQRRILSADTVPDVLVCDAVYASCCVPFLFPPFELPDGTKVVDGCMSENVPNVFDEHSTLFVTVRMANDNRSIDSWSAFLNCIVLCAVVAQHPPTGQRFDLVIHNDKEKSSIPMSIDFTEDDVTRSVCAGYAATLDALSDGELVRQSAHLVNVLTPFTTIQEPSRCGTSADTACLSSVE
jgi:predicted acylesterase/phospholipase RssA